MKKTLTLTFLFLSIVSISFGQFPNLRNSNRNKSNGANTKMKTFSNFILKQKLDSVVFQEYAFFYSYDEQGKIIENIEKYWDFDNDIWHESNKYVYEYDNNLLSEQTEFSKEDEMQNWGKSSKIEYFYDQNLLNFEVNLRWNENSEQWDNSSRVEYFYKNGQLDYDVYSSWIKSESTWAPIDKTEYFYNDNKLIKTIYYSKTNDEWENKFKTEFDRTDSLYVEFYFTYSNDQWVKSSKNIAPIDDFGNLSERVFYDWDDDISDWEPSYKLSLTYDNNYAASDLLLPFVLDENLLLFNHKLDKLEENEWEDESWVVSSEGNLHYSGLDISSTNNNMEEIAVAYPNPANNFIIFKTANEQNIVLDIYNSNGQKISSKSILSNQIVNIESLQNGFYFYHLKNGTMIVKGSFIKISE